MGREGGGGFSFEGEGGIVEIRVPKEEREGSPRILDAGKEERKTLFVLPGRRRRRSPRSPKEKKREEGPSISRSDPKELLSQKKGGADSR